MRDDLTTRTLKQEMIKADNLIESAQQQLDGANKSKASQSAIKHLEQRVKALNDRKKKFEAALTKHTNQGKAGKQPKVKKNAAPTSGEKVEDEKEGDE